MRSIALEVAVNMNIVQMNGAQPTDNEGAQNGQKKPDKPLRFVTNYGAPHPKRRRIGAACLTCRKRKTACSGKAGISGSYIRKCTDVFVAQVSDHFAIRASRTSVRT